MTNVSDKRKEQNRSNIATFREKMAKETGRKQRTYFTDDEDIANMNEIKKLWNAVGEYSSLVEHRKEQLQKEKEIDNRLKSCSTCPQTVSSYFLKLRELNRKLSEKLYDVPFYQFPSEYVEHIKTINSVQPEIENTNEMDVCFRVLPEINRRIDNLLEKES